MAAPPKKPAGGGLSLYADLLEPDKSKTSSATISSAPVKYDVKSSSSAAEEAAAKKKDASLKFQPIKRPQVPQKTKPKASSSSAGAGSSSSSTHKFSSSTITASVSASSPEKQLPPHSHSTPAQQQQQQQQPGVQPSNFSDWIGGDGEDDDYYYHHDNKPKAERGGKRGKKKKNKTQERVWDWDDIYDPTLPNSYAEYKGSEEQAREIRDWKARLYYRQLREARKARKDGMESEDDDEGARVRPVNSMFAPPSNLSFAPPSFDDGVGQSRVDEDDEDDYYPPSHFNSNDQETKPYDAPPAFAPAAVPDDATGEDAYMRRMRLSGMASSESPAPQQAPPPPPPPAAEPAPTPPPIARPTDAEIDARRAEAAAKIAAFKAKIAGQAPKPPTPTPQTSNPPPESQHPPPPPPPPAEDAQEPSTSNSNTISRAPVRYNIPPPPTQPQDPSPDIPIDSTTTPTPPPPEPPKSSRPGQKNFAERLLKRYGWEKGHGLGATGTGITTAIVAKAEKRKKRPDAEGGGWVAPANMGKLVGGKRRKIEGQQAETQGQEGEEEVQMSEVVKFEGMLDGLDVAKEIEEKNLMQEIGEEMQSQYGNVERVFIWREEMGGGNEVFVKFTSVASAVRAVQGMQGSEFAGNEVRAGFWDTQRFEEGVYD